MGAKPAQESKQEGERLGEVGISLPLPNELVLDDPSGYVCCVCLFHPMPSWSPVGEVITSVGS